MKKYTAVVTLTVLSKPKTGSPQKSSSNRKSLRS